MDLSSDELRVRALCADGQHTRAVVVILETYGQELYSFLLARFPARTSLAEDAFSEFTEDLLRGLAKFEWRCSVRSWCYRLARSAASRVGRSVHQRRNYRVPLSEASVLDDAVQRARTTTAPYLQTSIKDEFAKLRSSLSEDDRELLTLRVDRELSFREIAYVMLPGEPCSAAEQLRNEAALRQRFTEIKKRLRKLAVEAGIL